jgi:hypothetical protein
MTPDEFSAEKTRKANESLAQTPPIRMTPEEYFAELARLEREEAAKNKPEERKKAAGKG